MSVQAQARGVLRPVVGPTVASLPPKRCPEPSKVDPNLMRASRMEAHEIALLAQVPGDRKRTLALRLGQGRGDFVHPDAPLGPMLNRLPEPCYAHAALSSGA